MSLALAVAEILKRTPKVWGVSLAQGHAHFSSGWDFMMGLANPSCMLNLKSLASSIMEIYGNLFLKIGINQNGKTPYFWRN